MSELCLRNRQRALPVDLRLLRRIARVAIAQLFGPASYEIGIQLLGSRSMATLNKSFLNHEGPTDVITFDHSNGGTRLHGEIFLCPQVAREQARRFGVSWQKELTRYLIHGLLHLQGYDDKTISARQIMKRKENRMVRRMATLFPLNHLGGQPKFGL